MILDLEFVHKGVFVSLYFLLFLATFVFLERLLYFLFSFPAEKKLFLKEASELDSVNLEASYHSFVSKVSKRKGVFSFVITASPLLGLLGTVLGIMNSFFTMAEKGVSNIVEVSKGIGFALEATALGIFVALVSLVYYHLLNGLISEAKTELKVNLLKRVENKE